jgi:hypothetical protein
MTSEEVKVELSGGWTSKTWEYKGKCWPENTGTSYHIDLVTSHEIPRELFPQIINAIENVLNSKNQQ